MGYWRNGSLGQNEIYILGKLKTTYMKHLILVFIAATLLFSCKNKQTTDHKPGSSEK